MKTPFCIHLKVDINIQAKYLFIKEDQPFYYMKFK